MDTDVVAWWGAIVATLVAGWDVYKWYTAARRIHVVVTGNMMLRSSIGGTAGPFVAIRVTNRGERATSITNIGFKYYRTGVRRLLRKPETTFMISQPNPDDGLPRLLQAGEVWDGRAHQDTEIEAMSREGHLIWLIIHSAGSRPVRRRLRIEKLERLPNHGD